MDNYVELEDGEIPTGTTLELEEGEIPTKRVREEEEQTSNKKARYDSEPRVEFYGPQPRDYPPALPELPSNVCYSVNLHAFYHDSLSITTFISYSR